MIFLGIILTMLLGFSILNFLFRPVKIQDIHFAEISGLSFIIGIGIETVFMFLLDLVQIKITILSLLVPTIILTSLLLWLNPYPFIKKLKPRVDLFKPAGLLPKNIPWVLIFALIAFLLVGSIAKSTYWPTTSYDSVAGYDLMGKVIAAEGKIHVSLFETGVQGARGIYPPLIEGSFAYAYLFGLESSKIITSLTYLSLIFIFYSLLRKYVTSLNAILFTLLLIITPEMFAHSSLSLSNIPGAVYAGLGLIYLFLWYDKEEGPYFFIAALLLGLNVWARNDGIVFNLAGLMLVAYHCYREKKYRKIVYYFLISFLPFIIWSLYLKYNIEISQDRFVNHLFWDAERFWKIVNGVQNLLFSLNVYGITFYIFIISILINFKKFLNDKIEFVLMIFVSFFLYSAIYYQLDPVKQDSIEVLLRASFKRGIFYFVPLVFFYISVSKPINSFFNKIEVFRQGSKLQADS